MFFNRLKNRIRFATQCRNAQRVRFI